VSKRIIGKASHVQALTNDTNSTLAYHWQALAQKKDRLDSLVEQANDASTWILLHRNLFSKKSKKSALTNDASSASYLSNRIIDKPIA
jgi:hypothetical protein